MRWSRRRLLGTAGPGLAGLAVGCPRPSPEVERAFVGQDPERGHLLRDGAVASAPVADRIRCDVLVIGGGASGLAAAWRLARAGERSVHLLELEPGLGGTARSGHTPRSRYPMGAHYLPSPHPELGSLQTLLLDLGIAVGRDARGELELDPRAVCRAPLERHRYRGRWDEGLYPGAGQSGEDEAQWERWQAHLRALDARRGEDGRRLFDLPTDRSSRELRHLDQISMATYLDRLGFDGWRLRWAVDYALRDDYGCTLEQCSAFAGLHHYLSRGLEDTQERFILTWPEGNAHLVGRMADAAGMGDRMHHDTVAHAIDPDSGRVHAYDFAARRQRVFEAQQILWTAPRFVLPRVLPPGRDPLRPGSLGYVPWLVANVELTRRPRGVGAPLSWDNVPVDTDDLGYVVATHLEPLSERVREGTVVTFYQPLPAADDAGLRRRRAELLAGSLDHWCDHVTTRLEAMHPGIGPDIRRIHVARWGHAMIQPRPGHLFGEGRAIARQAIGRVLPCAADVGGLPLFEEAFAGGVRGAEHALARLGRPPEERLL
ncbi:MAG: NAD(P)-binding protein [Myxococcales bacterium]|nr:NAD(P)-binding protein [Myxococcales bacterium]MCB9713154.1 NAD(P)-binding protein [Myxococcales bacterium]